MIEIKFQPGVGLLDGTCNVHTKFRSGKLHFFKFEDSNHISMDDFDQSVVDKLISGKHQGITYLGYTELKTDV